MFAERGWNLYILEWLRYVFGVSIGSKMLVSLDNSVKSILFTIRQGYNNQVVKQDIIQSYKTNLY